MVMESFSQFLESSTIHGLTYISTTRRFAKLFWILVVITSFVGASLLIKESFASWSESPIKTNIETLPISEIKLPKVTVCPPKNTFTDLNYDLMMMEKLTLTDEMRDEMFKYAIDVINEDSFSQSDWSMLQEEDRFYNWYYGYTEIQAPSYMYEKWDYLVHTAATSGVVSIQYYGEQFTSRLVERKFRFMVEVNPPANIKNNENVTLHFSLEQVRMTGLPGSSREYVMMKGRDPSFVEDHLTTAYTNFTPPKPDGVWNGFHFFRDVTSEDIELLQLDVMPGFRLSWWYTGPEVTPDPDHKYKDEEITKHLVR